MVNNDETLQEGTNETTKGRYTRYTYESSARLARNIADFRCVRYANIIA